MKLKKLEDAVLFIHFAHYLMEGLSKRGRPVDVVSGESGFKLNAHAGDNSDLSFALLMSTYGKFSIEAHCSAGKVIEFTEKSDMQELFESALEKGVIAPRKDHVADVVISSMKKAQAWLKKYGYRINSAHCSIINKAAIAEGNKTKLSTFVLGGVEVPSKAEDKGLEAFYYLKGKPGFTGYYSYEGSVIRPIYEFRSEDEILCDVQLADIKISDLDLVRVNRLSATHQYRIRDWILKSLDPRNVNLITYDEVSSSIESTQEWF